MRRLLPALFAFALISPAHAQAMPADAHRDLYCGTAFRLIMVIRPDATEDEKKVVSAYISAADALLARGAASMSAAGFTPEAIEAEANGLIGTVMKQLRNEEPPEFGPDDCDVMLAQFLPPTPPSSEPPSSTPAP